MLFMVIERFRDNDMIPVYRRVRDAGRMLPEGLLYIDSWIEPSFARCFQLMECSDLACSRSGCSSGGGAGLSSRSSPWSQARTRGRSWRRT